MRSEAYGVLALTYREERTFNDLDVRLAASFGGQVALAIENARLRDEIGQAAAATERSRLARDLHDSVTQSLFAASLKAEAIRRRWRPTSDEARDNVEDVERLARGALAEMRTLLMEMRPDTLAEASLATLLEQLAAATEGGSRVSVHVRGPRQRAAAAARERGAVPHRPGGAPEREPPFRRDRGVGYARHDGARGPPVRARQRARVRRSDGDAGALRAGDDARARRGRRRRGHGRERAGRRHHGDRGLASATEKHDRGRLSAGRRRREKIRVVIVDDHVLVRSGLEVVFGMFDDIELAGQAGDGEEAVRLCRELRPDVVLMDLVMPGLSGVEATRQILASCPGTKVVALTSFTEEDLIGETLRAGAIGYLMKNVSADQLADAVRAAHAGRSTLAPEAADALVRSVSAPHPSADSLTARERDVLKLMADGLTNADIAERLVIGVATVKTHVSSIISKLGVSTRTEATAMAIRRGLV